MRDRKTVILEIGANLAAKHGAINVTRRMVAKAAKLPESVVSYYMGGADDAQRAYTKHAKKLGLTLPTKQEAEAIGVKLRAHKPRDARDTRRRSVKEVEAIKRKPKGNRMVLPEKIIGKAAVKSLRAAAPASASRATATGTSPATKVIAPPSTKPAKAPKVNTPGPASTPAQTPPSTKTAARLPKAPPSLPALPTASSTGTDDGIGSGSPSPAS
jgi:hypothetical protein